MADITTKKSGVLLLHASQDIHCTHRHTKRQTVRSTDVTVCQLSLYVNAVRINPFVAKKKSEACPQRDNVRMADFNSKKQRLCEIPFFSITNAELYKFMPKNDCFHM